MPARKQPCDPIRSLYVFQVSGSGEFPIDMLRYDSCWPKSEPQSAELRGSFKPWGTGKRTVELIGTHEPTEGRWASFGWQVL